MQSTAAPTATTGKPTADLLVEQHQRKFCTAIDNLQTAIANAQASIAR